MAKRIKLTLLASLDKRDILHYWKERNQSNTYSIKLDKAFYELFEELALFPNIGVLSIGKDVYSIVFRDYRIYYHIENDTLIILRIWDTRRNPDSFSL